ncbi:hypothetical protein PUN28_006465 [Cardiocondyla obscurior]|uniref:Uncharacterized protein n=1 Tax=Cardiocondyla obscurior TaxID=286306 RepID=A0AAW2G8S5_9HYME
MSSNARLMYPGARRRHCRNYPLRPPGPSERCLASTPYLEPAELSPPLSPLSHSVTLFFPSPLPLPFPSVLVEHVRTRVSPRSPSWGPVKPNQPARLTTRPPTLPNPPSPPSLQPLRYLQSFSLSPSVDLLSSVVRGCGSAV